VEHLPNFLHGWYASDFRFADEGFYTGQVAVTTKGQESCWEHWAAYIAPLGVDPFLQDTLFTVPASLLGLPLKFGRGTMVEENKSKLGAYLAQSRPLDRQLRWPQTPTPPKYWDQTSSFCAFNRYWMVSEKLIPPLPSSSW
jgi:hypothetical protein